VASAREAIAPGAAKPSQFPVTDPLERVPRGAKIAFMDCGTPICSLFWELIQPAGEAMGVEISRVRAGSTADTVRSAFDSIVSQKPDGVIVAAINPELWQSALKELQDAGVPIVTTGVIDAARYGIEAPQASDAEFEREGRLMADYVAAEFGMDSKVALYKVPELALTQVVADSFTEELERVCPDCTVRTVDIPVATLGSTAPSRVVSDLQANPDTTVTAFAADEIQNGLPAAKKTAGIEVDTIGIGAGPTNFQQLKRGEETAVLASDFAVLSWTLVDQVARGIVGQELSGDQAQGLNVIQFLTSEDVTFDPSRGWTGYPDFAERFMELWGVGG
jgi:ribose transport system substrate-binding protein